MIRLFVNKCMWSHTHWTYGLLRPPNHLPLIENKYWHLPSYYQARGKRVENLTDRNDLQRVLRDNLKPSAWVSFQRHAQMRKCSELPWFKKKKRDLKFLHMIQTRVYWYYYNIPLAIFYSWFICSLKKGFLFCSIKATRCVLLSDADQRSRGYCLDFRRAYLRVTERLMIA